MYCSHVLVKPVSVKVSKEGEREYRAAAFVPSLSEQRYSDTPERGAAGSRRPSCLSVGGAGGAKVPFLNAMICFIIVNMIQRRSYKLRSSNI